MTATRDTLKPAIMLLACQARRRHETCAHAERKRALSSHTAPVQVQEWLRGVDLVDALAPIDEFKPYLRGLPVDDGLKQRLFNIIELAN